MTLDALNGLAAADAEREFLRCCGSVRWARAMAEARPFASAAAFAATADAVWGALDRRDVLEAFAAHPRIGGETRSSWETSEQTGIGAADMQTRARFAVLNRQYEERFGYMFIVCATGRSAEEMLAILTQRLANAPDAEWRIAADEQRRITRLRLEKLLS